MATSNKKSTNAAKKAPPARPGAKRRTRSGRPAGLFTWVTIGAVVIVIAGIILIKVVSSSTPNQKYATGFHPVPASIMSELTGVSLSTFNQVGINASITAVTVPTALSGATELNWKGTDGVKRPTVYYFGAEYCPFCAAERWVMIVALSRFGTFTNVGLMASSSTDYAPNTPTYTFVNATYTSPYINFSSVESAKNTVNPKTGSWYLLQKPNKAQTADLEAYDTPSYIPSVQNAGDIPFISFNNKWLIGGAQYSPLILKNLSQSTIASDLNYSTSLLGQPIIAAANLLSAAVCDTDGQMPVAVCTSSGVKAADSAMSIKTS
jgi:hypothetical protein